MERKSAIYYAVSEELPRLTGEQQDRLRSEIALLYDKTQEVVCPVIVSFADHLLQGVRGDRDKIVFVARDALSYHLAAQALVGKFPGYYPRVNRTQLVYAFLTRKVVNDDPKTLRSYLGFLGLSPGDNIVVADIGMYGSIVYSISRNLPDFKIRYEYLISKNASIPGYIDDGDKKRMVVFQQIIGNPAVHFLEDTFSGTIPSPSHMERTRQGYQPDTQGQTYPPEIRLKREYALHAVTDYVENLLDDPRALSKDRAIKKLDRFLLDRRNFQHLMVPHER